ncbi:MAG: hypothetical protein VSS75_028280 [Candidatus Parabeggiatoa sp.]|nr:hypothetical protein [Candidatus Parabeggiatoa sp.]
MTTLFNWFKKFWLIIFMIFFVGIVAILNFDVLKAMLDAFSKDGVMTFPGKALLASLLAVVTAMVTNPLILGIATLIGTWITLITCYLNKKVPPS